MIVTSKNGTKYSVPDTDSFFIKTLQGRIYQGAHVDYLRRLVPNARNIIDIGANIGQSAVEYSKFSQVTHAFEPSPSSFAHLTETINLNDCKNVRLYNCAVGETTQEMRITHRRNNTGSNHLLAPNRNVKNSKIIQVNRLDDYNFTDVDIIKIDVEGFEMSVLLGAEQTIQHNRPVIQTEVIERHLCRNATTAQDIQNWFTARNYQRTLCTGEIIQGNTFIPRPRQGDSFWIPKERKDLLCN